MEALLMSETIVTEMDTLASGDLPVELLPDVAHLVTEDDTPVDNLASEKQMRLLTEPLYTAWSGPGDERPFLAAANVGLFASVHKPPVVPDMFLSLDVTAPDNWWEKGKRAYFFWEFGKAPDLVIEIVSNWEGGEDGRKMQTYARMGIPYYVIYDPLTQIQPDILRAYALTPRREYEEIAPDLFVGLDLGLSLWRGSYENKEELWLRWHDVDGRLIPTGAELSAAERQRADAAERRAARLAAKLRELGVEPDGD
jgi:Uma2 family endonuclease